jgi:hypothetical protein
MTVAEQEPGVSVCGLKFEPVDAGVEDVATKVKSALPATPVPVSAAVWGLEESRSKTFNVALSAEVVVGVIVTLRVQEELPARLAPQVVVRAKSLAFGPEKGWEVLMFMRLLLQTLESVN